MSLSDQDGHCTLVFHIVWSRYPIWGVRFCVWIRIRVAFKKKKSDLNNFPQWPGDTVCPGVLPGVRLWPVRSWASSHWCLMGCLLIK